MWEFIDKVVYINLEHRTDRREHMEQFTKTFGDKVIRFNAIKEETAWIACTKSHIAALQMALDAGWKNVLILEDDAEWNDFASGYSKLEKIVENPFDAVVLGGTDVWYYPANYRLVSCQAASAYLVNAHYIPTVIENFEEALVSAISTGERSTYAIDVYWKKLHAKDTWYIVKPALVYQAPNYSDLQGGFVDYRQMFELPETSS